MLGRRHRLIRRWLVTDAAAHAGARLADLLDPGNTASAVWADTGYRSKKNEELLRQRMLVSHIHRKKPAGRTLPERHRAGQREEVGRAGLQPPTVSTTTPTDLRRALEPPLLRQQPVKMPPSPRSRQR